MADSTSEKRQYFIAALIICFKLDSSDKNRPIFSFHQISKGITDWYNVQELTRPVLYPNPAHLL